MTKENCPSCHDKRVVAQYLDQHETVHAVTVGAETNRKFMETYHATKDPDMKAWMQRGDGTISQSWKKTTVSSEDAGELRILTFSSADENWPHTLSGKFLKDVKSFSTIEKFCDRMTRYDHGDEPHEGDGDGDWEQAVVSMGLATDDPSQAMLFADDLAANNVAEFWVTGTESVNYVEAIKLSPEEHRVAALRKLVPRPPSLHGRAQLARERDPRLGSEYAEWRDREQRRAQLAREREQLGGSLGEQVVARLLN